ncbi:emp24 gp25l p24 family of membrane trafficking proteins [Stylonychia lemnae]|uniref:Emp24 gp25l p24 family of membrane trafficking proteins n=1 Tax=Stylonychia lemnae TaxID=5949 RepID=A0A078AZ53_STYLE|nr:emp24 gp25l p24 family of membrane trafficking proteins [Stylonychia lemnae]|eukprot:CDW87419.1 emp24 gp25l p24 family of membrane trafficking proteins [Stylonychia lemnae]
MQKQDPYCFMTPVKKYQDIQVNYMISGINEEQVSFTVSYVNGGDIYADSGKRENEVVVKAKEDSKVNLCWQKLDRKTKKLTFNFQVTSIDSDAKAGSQTVDRISNSVQRMQNKLDTISRNVYMQNEMDRQHSDLIGVCFGQIYFITQFFTSKSTKMGKDNNPFGRSMV